MLLNKHKTKVNIGFFYTIISKIERIHYYFEFFFIIWPSPFFFFIHRQMRFLILGRSVGLKKKKKPERKSQEVSE